MNQKFLKLRMCLKTKMSSNSLKYNKSQIALTPHHLKSSSCLNHKLISKSLRRLLKSHMSN
jgi:hypothetical protein